MNGSGDGQGRDAIPPPEHRARDAGGASDVAAPDDPSLPRLQADRAELATHAPAPGDPPLPGPRTEGAEWAATARAAPVAAPTAPGDTPEPIAVAAGEDAGAAPPLDDHSLDDLSLDDRIVAALREIYDPEIPVNIYDLGLIYRIDCDALGVVEIDMTLTAPGCPVAQTFPGTVEAAVQNVEGVATAEVDLVWEPPWTPDRMSEAAKLELGFF